VEEAEACGDGGGGKCSQSEGEGDHCLGMRLECMILR
jgi:hypothetical protein